MSINTNLVEQQKAERISLIRQAAHNLLISKGYSGLTMRSLADECGLSVPTLYNLIGGKDEIIAQDANQTFQKVVERIQTKESADALTKTLELYDAVIEITLADADYYRALLPIGDSNQAIREIREHGAQAYQTFLASILKTEAKALFEPHFELVLALRELYDLSNSVMTKWATGQVPEAILKARLLYGVGLILGAGAKGKAAKQLQTIKTQSAKQLREFESSQ